MSYIGSPPHGRGKGRSSPCTARRCRITPAWAGKRHSCRMRRWCSGDHPRVGGEKPGSCLCPVLIPGSPPRRRGKVCAGELGHRADGITPAQAGKRHSCRMRRWCSGDHPRVGGEKPGSCLCPVLIPGSPPRRRGKVCAGELGHRADGITPAWAGKSLFCFTAAVPIQDHPRMGGEKCSVQAVYLVPQGSPPHGRGKGAPSRSSWAAAGITPAWAGKSYDDWCTKVVSEDHPRMGGEKLERRTFWACMVGSPPHGRGKVSCFRCHRIF